jgi:hypothetical protein
MVKEMVKVHINTLMEINSKENGKMMKNKWVSILLSVVTSFKENLKMVR